jgi:hypothetical protein
LILYDTRNFSSNLRARSEGKHKHCNQQKRDSLFYAMHDALLLFTRELVATIACGRQMAFRI